MPSQMSALDYFVGPFAVIIPLGLLVLVLRWGFSRGGSLVTRVDTRPKDPRTFGLLTAVHTTKAYADARKLIDRLIGAQIRATAARTTDGWTVYVWPKDVDAARDVIKSAQQ